MKQIKHIVFGLIIVFFQTIGFSQPLKPRFQFGIIADVQFCDCETSGTRHYRGSPEKFTEAVNEFNKHELDFVASLGDFIDRDFGSFEVVNQIAKDLKFPLWHALGNHEWSVEDSLKSQVPSRLDLNDRYYSKSVKGWRFIFLDGNAVSLHGTENGSEEYKEAQQIFQTLKSSNAPNAYRWNGALGTKQLRWVDQELQSAKGMNQRVVFLCHFPVVPYPGSHNLWDDAKLLELINQNDQVVAYFNGHVHKGYYEEVSKVHFVTFDGMVEEDTNSFAIVSVFQDRLEIKGFGRETDRILSIY